jgi:hypothetical protein
MEIADSPGDILLPGGTMSCLLRCPRFVGLAALLLVGGCEGTEPTRPASGAAGTGTSTGAAGQTQTTGAAGTGMSTGVAGQTQTTGAAGTGITTTGQAGTGGGAAGATTTGAAGTGTMTGAAGTGTTMGAAGAGASSECSPPPPRPLNVTGTGTYSQHGLYLNKDKKPAQGKLWLLLPGIGNTSGAGGFESFIKLYGFHVFAPQTNTNLTGGSVPQMYKDIIKTDPLNKEANRQVGDARTDEWDGKGRVNWFTPPTPMLTQTINALKTAMTEDPEGDWGFFLNADGTLRTTDVAVVGYSWGAQTWAMISTYVRFGRVISASGPVNEGFPNGTWMTDPSATPVNCKYALVSDGQAGSIFPNVQKAGWPGAIVMVSPTSPGPYTAEEHLFQMNGGNGGTTPGGHTVFCNDNLMNGWRPVCKHVVGVPP